MMGLLGNVAEVQFLRHHLMVPLFISIFRSSLILILFNFLQVTLFVSIRPHSSAHSGDSSTQRPTLPSRPSIRSFTLQGLETSSWSSLHALNRPTPQRHWICSCQPLDTDRQAILRGHGGATRRPELATR